ncbi:N-6 DNA methylase [Nocardia noduli]|uniref:N-6 DNA methylase n=1 Tax=Nocardia noduli TaxID=2815722 RepID=UPI001C241829|nr:N-6 DNA methylase [Nocardia noduli]
MNDIDPILPPLWRAIRASHTGDESDLRAITLALLCLAHQAPHRWQALLQDSPAEQTRQLPAALARVVPGFIERANTLPIQDIVEIPELIAAIETAIEAATHTGPGTRMPTPHVQAELFYALLHAFARTAHDRDTVVFASSFVERLAVMTTAPRPGDKVLVPVADAGTLLAEAAWYMRADGAAMGPDHAGGYGAPGPTGSTAAAFYDYPLPPGALSGQTSSADAQLLARMNLAVNEIDATLIVGAAESFPAFAHEKFDVVMAIPWFNQRHRFTRHDRTPGNQWVFGVPPAGNANYGWLQHTYAQLRPGGRAAIILPRTATRSRRRDEHAIREAMIGAHAVEAVIGVPAHTTDATPAGFDMWLLQHPLVPDTTHAPVLFIDASAIRHTVGDAELLRAITRILHDWREHLDRYHDQPGICVGLDHTSIRDQDYSLAPRTHLANQHNASRTPHPSPSPTTAAALPPAAAGVVEPLRTRPPRPAHRSPGDRTVETEPVMPPARTTSRSGATREIAGGRIRSQPRQWGRSL